MLYAMDQQENLGFEKPLSARLIHGKGPWWSQRFQNISLVRPFGFTVVRNPFTRALSAFLDKLAIGRIHRHQFYFQHGIPPNRELSFTEFLRYLDPSKTLLDQHFAPQVNNILLGLVPLDAVYYLENFSQTAPDLEQQVGNGIRFSRQQSHGTQASEKLLAFLTDEAIERITTLYRDDFEIFGYSTDPADALEAPDKFYRPAAPETLQVLDILGWHLSGSDAAQTAATVRKMGLSAQDRLMMADILPDFPGRTLGFGPLLGETAFSGTPAAQFAALRYCIMTRASGITPQYRQRALRTLIYLAPYQIGFRQLLVRLLINRGDAEAAARELEDLRKVTWQTAMVNRLSGELAARLKG